MPTHNKRVIRAFHLSLRERLWVDGPHWLAGVEDKDRVTRALQFVDRHLIAICERTSWQDFMDLEGEEFDELEELVRLCMDRCIGGLLEMVLNLDETKRAFRARARATPS
jgi:hypothetical protein